MRTSEQSYFGEIECIEMYRFNKTGHLERIIASKVIYLHEVAPMPPLSLPFIASDPSRQRRGSLQHAEDAKYCRDSLLAHCAHVKPIPRNDLIRDENKFPRVHPR
jgi:hypothetical protein